MTEPPPPEAPPRIKRVCVVGGTHGNEWTGAHLARHWRSTPDELHREGLDVEALLANPRALQARTRYVDRDLNRCFGPAVLSPEGSPPRPAGGTHAADAEATDLYEPARARALVGQMMLDHGPDEVAIFDLHTTTSNMGKSVVLGRLSPFNVALAAWLQQRDDEVRIYRWVEAGVEPGFLSGICHNGFNLEVGPVANNVLDPTMLRWTRELVAGCLDFAAAWNDAAFRHQASAQPVEVFSHVAHVDYPRDAEGHPTAYVHPERMGRDFEPLHPGDPLFLTFAGETLPYEGEAGQVAVFINEAAYYEKGIALTLTRPETLRGDQVS